MKSACPRCGSTGNPANAKFCRSCGGSLESASAGGDIPQSEAGSEPGTPPRNGLRRLPHVAVAILVAGGLIAGAYLIGSSVGDDSDRIAELEDELADAEGELADVEDEHESLENDAQSLEQDLAAAEERLQKLSGAEGALEDATAGLGEVQTVSQGNSLKLEEMTATLGSWETTDVVSDEFDSRRADGIFVVATVTLANRLNSKVTVDPEETFLLLVGPRTFNPDFDAMNFAGGERSWLDVGLDGIQPGTSVTGSVIFDIAGSSAKQLEKDGILIAKQFSDAEFLAGRPQLPVAGLRLSG